ncbi:zinc ribbon domain-containing protein [bacterium]|nr:zinc ribbon domain-containing protein [bacterium]
MKRKYKFCPLCGHYLKFRTIEGQRRLICQQCGWVNYDNPLPVLDGYRNSICFKLF